MHGAGGCGLKKAAAHGKPAMNLIVWLHFGSTWTEGETEEIDDERKAEMKHFELNFPLLHSPVPPGGNR